MVVIIDSRADIANEKLILAKLKKYHVAVLSLSVIGIIFLVWAIVATALNITTNHVEHITVIPKTKSAIYKEAAVVTDSVYCAEIARNVIIQGGNAVDAAIAATFCNGVVLPYATGLGGGGFMIIYLKDQKKCVFLNSRETAPSASTEKMFSNDQEEAQLGYKSIGIPGELHGLYTAYQKYGSKVVPWSDLVMPAAKLARGFPNHIAMFDYYDRIQKYADKDEVKPLKKLYTNKMTGKYYEPGEIVTNYRLAKTLEAIANSADPIELFYNGEIAKGIVGEMDINGGIITADDLKTYTTDIQEALYSELGGYKLCGPPPPSSWAITQAIPRIIEKQYKNREYFNDAEFYHKLIEAEKLAYGQRGNLGDGNFDENSIWLANNLTKDDYIQSLSNRLPDSPEDIDYYMISDDQAVNDAGTSHSSIIDDDGNAVSTSTSINTAFGSKMLSKYGFIYNNQMDDFSTPDLINHWGFTPSKTNYIKPGRRPMSSMSPTIVFDSKSGDVRMVTGATGGSKIISATAQTLTRGILVKQTAAEIVEFPRLHNQLTPYETLVEVNFSKKIEEKLASDYQQKLKETKGNLAIVYPITKQNGYMTAASDYRRKTGNLPAGY
ncbi:unnamed protein product [Caenorhabditis angaria]|uniref:Gamma-glutamyltransferase n=1 Tax=Caenorhabditis angaria TaxID=860376 RepID=A0A9P1IRB8_9PELO|nr:unnamed protein product [Caenorhabditis angaria]